MAKMKGEERLEREVLNRFQLCDSGHVQETIVFRGVRWRSMMRYTMSG